MYYLLLHTYKYNYYELVTKIDILTLITFKYRLPNYSHFINEKKSGPSKGKEIAPFTQQERRRGLNLKP